MNELDQLKQELEFREYQVRRLKLKLLLIKMKAVSACNE